MSLERQHSSERESEGRGGKWGQRIAISLPSGDTSLVWGLIPPPPPPLRRYFLSGRDFWCVGKRKRTIGKQSEMLLYYYSLVNNNNFRGAAHINRSAEMKLLLLLLLLLCVWVYIFYGWFLSFSFYCCQRRRRGMRWDRIPWGLITWSASKWMRRAIKLK